MCCWRGTGGTYEYLDSFCTPITSRIGGGDARKENFRHEPQADPVGGEREMLILLPSLYERK